MTMMMMMMMMSTTTAKRPKRLKRRRREDDEDAAAGGDDGDDFDPVAGMSTAAERARGGREGVRIVARRRRRRRIGAGHPRLAPISRGDDEAGGDSRNVQAPRAVLAVRGARRGEAADDADNGDQDFFANMGHLQAHRRCRALRKMAKACEDGTIPFAAINGYLAPLAVASLGDGGADVASTAAAAIGSLASALPWASYRDLLLWMLRKAGGNRASARRGATPRAARASHRRAAATVLESFHEFEDEAEGEEATNVVCKPIHPAVVATLRADILPHLEKLTVVEDKEGKGGTVRPAASAAVVSLLRLLPEQDLDADIGRACWARSPTVSARARRA